MSDRSASGARSYINPYLGGALLGERQTGLIQKVYWREEY